MGSEMSCPCYRKNYVEEEPVKENNVIEDYFSKRFCKENLLFNFSISNIKLCVFSSDLLENFFKNKNTIKHTTKPSTVYNNINITNVLKNNDQCLVILENFEINTSKNTEFCLTNIDLDHNKINLENIIENHSDFQVNEFNLLSNDEKKIFDLIQMNLNVMLKKDYILIGVINSSNRNLRDYKMLFKKSIKVENEINYHIYLHETVLTQIEINNVLSKNQDKKLKSVIVLSKTKDNFNIGKYYFFIFEKQNSKIIEKDFLVIDMKKKLMPNDVFLEDLATKLNNMHNQKLYGYKLSCIINDDDSLFLIMREEIQAESPDYIYEEF